MRHDYWWPYHAPVWGKTFSVNCVNLDFTDITPYGHSTIADGDGSGNGAVFLDTRINDVDGMGMGSTPLGIDYAQD